MSREPAAQTFHTHQVELPATARSHRLAASPTQANSAPPHPGLRPSTMGSGEFVESVLQNHFERSSVTHDPEGILHRLVSVVASRFGISQDDMACNEKRSDLVAAHAVVSFVAFDHFGVSKRRIGDRLGVKTQSVMRGIDAGRRILVGRGWTLHEVLTWLELSDGTSRVMVDCRIGISELRVCESINSPKSRVLISLEFFEPKTLNSGLIHNLHVPWSIVVVKGFSDTRSPLAVRSH